MAAAIAARRYGLEVMVIDDQPGPGGQIWRSVEQTARRDHILGASYVEGRDVAKSFHACGARYVAGAQLWQIEPGFRAFVSREQKTQMIDARSVILAAGAQERPIPFPGWTLPGVLTVGAAQILLKSAGEIPDGPVWIAGCGPLPLLYIFQLVRAGGQIAGYLDTTPAGQWRTALPYMPAALQAWTDLAKGLGWKATLRKHKIPVIKHVSDVEALGNGRVEALRYRTADSAWVTVKAETILVHEGVVPSIHAALSLGCDVAWVTGQDCFAPIVDIWGESSQAGLFIAGDGAGIAGAKAALLRGTLAALRVAEKLGRITTQAASVEARPVRRKLERELAVRPFLDALFRPRPQIFAPDDRAIVCRCEEVTAGEIRALACVGQPGPNQVKAATRAGMGPCQGRQCGYTITCILSKIQNRQPDEVGFYHVRPPLKPVTLGELASLDQADTP